MASAHDVAAYILDQRGAMTAMKLQKLVYYAQAWHLVWDEEPLFDEEIQAWANGPVVPALYMKHRGAFTVANWPAGNPAALEQHEVDTIDAVLRDYGDMTAHELSILTHRERPWRDARVGLQPGQRSSRVIAYSDMAEYYLSLIIEPPDHAWVSE